MFEDTYRYINARSSGCYRWQERYIEEGTTICKGNNSRRKSWKENFEEATHNRETLKDILRKVFKLRLYIYIVE